MSSTKTVEERRSSPVAATGGFGSLFKFKIPEAKYGVLLTALALSLIYIDAFATRLFSVLRFESVIHEFDPNFAPPAGTSTSVLPSTSCTRASTSF
jgi:hypothetical protein